MRCLVPTRCHLVTIPWLAGGGGAPSNGVRPREGWTWPSPVWRPRPRLPRDLHSHTSLSIHCLSACLPACLPSHVKTRLSAGYGKKRAEAHQLWWVPPALACLCGVSAVAVSRHSTVTVNCVDVRSATAGQLGGWPQTRGQWPRCRPPELDAVGTRSPQTPTPANPMPQLLGRSRRRDMLVGPGTRPDQG